ncbi:hypothetical protein GOZ80_14050 [Agrobacterium vitis]|uniref:Uncharacterized protein n=1 Tax=Agrobacterium vitis TaxID=373 RepID=A0A1S2E0Q1_AGRVI|nr:hypothetical protein [Agrobacterium vitis]KAA3526133.1 hypothetical protein DXT89_16545 [Agrobacterium vitis]MUO96598.1 hypothetical protein [Agrobacterium vitis]MUZ99357.1 hypothetical protein [Agrobacterium vitis]MVA93129.1 hypothetical protein [Agrobacterium vitis]MVB04024.1 hypothetical protein [Agrobacterium vitis]
MDGRKVMAHTIIRKPQIPGEPWIGAVYAKNVCWTVAAKSRAAFDKKIEMAYREMEAGLARFSLESLIHADQHKLSKEYSALQYGEWWKLGNLEKD